MSFQPHLDLASLCAVPQGVGGQIFDSLLQPRQIPLYLDFLQLQGKCDLLLLQLKGKRRPDLPDQGG